VLLISAACVEVISAIPLLVRNEDRLEDVLKTDSVADDVADALRYGYKSQMEGKREAPREVRREEIARRAMSHTAKHMVLLGFEEKEKERQNLGHRRWR
jgi:hypothetical protein